MIWNMKEISQRVERPPTLKELYPELNDAQLKEAEKNLDRYLKLSIRMYDRIRNDPVEYARFKELTKHDEDSKLREEKKCNNL